MATRTNIRTLQILACSIIFALFIFNNPAKAQNWLTAGNTAATGYQLGLTTTTGTDSFSLVTHDTARIWIKSNGHVGIGTSATGQGYLLSVNGNVRAREIVVNTSTWADYVFNKDYKLPDLATLEQQIKDQKHLPGVPTATDVQNNGVPVGEMDKILLQKIEELTLYLIEQQKEIDALKKQINKQ